MAVMAITIAACSVQTGQQSTKLTIEKQGVFSSGGRVTDPIPGQYDPTQNWMDTTRKGTTRPDAHWLAIYSRR